MNKTYICLYKIDLYLLTPNFKKASIDNGYAQIFEEQAGALTVASSYRWALCQENFW